VIQVHQAVTEDRASDEIHNHYQVDVLRVGNHEDMVEGIRCIAIHVFHAVWDNDGAGQFGGWNRFDVRPDFQDVCCGRHHITHGRGKRAFEFFFAEQVCLH